MGPEGKYMKGCMPGAPPHIMGPGMAMPAMWEADGSAMYASAPGAPGIIMPPPGPGLNHGAGGRDEAAGACCCWCCGG